MSNIDFLKQSLDKIIDDKYVNVFLTFFLVLYGGLAAPRLPTEIAELFNNVLFKLLVLFLVAFYASKKPNIALLIAVSFYISLTTLQTYNINDKIKKSLVTIDVKPQSSKLPNQLVKLEEEKQVTNDQQSQQVTNDQQSQQVTNVPQSQQVTNVPQSQQVTNVPQSQQLTLVQPNINEQYANIINEKNDDYQNNLIDINDIREEFLNNMPRLNTNTDLSEVPEYKENTKAGLRKVKNNGLVKNDEVLQRIQNNDINEKSLDIDFVGYDYDNPRGAPLK
jgi:uncharacterized protein YkwD